MPETPNKFLNNDHGNYVFATFTGHIYDMILDIYFAEARFLSIWEISVLRERSPVKVSLVILTGIMVLTFLIVIQE